jgi:putative DNA primase/helicase
MVTPAAKSPYIAGGVDKTPGKGKATTRRAADRRMVAALAEAMIGLPMGENGLFALDFDPRKEEIVDPKTGEVTGVREWTLEQLKADTEAQIGCELPVTLAVRTPSGGVHLYYLQPDDGGEPLRNRGVLPQHVDVRGQGGYVIAPPSIIVSPAPAHRRRISLPARQQACRDRSRRRRGWSRCCGRRRRAPTTTAAADQAASSSPSPPRRPRGSRRRRRSRRGGDPALCAVGARARVRHAGGRLRTATATTRRTPAAS